MAAKCDLESCIDPKEIGCNRGHEILEECPNWQTGSAADLVERDPELAGALVSKDASAENAERQVHLPWTANSLGTLDIELVTACHPATLIGIVGPYNAGKTSLLTLIYLLIQRGEQLATGYFAGSTTLIGWENLAANFRWDLGDGGPKFPPHTSRNAGRRPGLLHLAIRDMNDLRNDFLLTDPPGEWFSAWSLNESADSAEGARWIDSYADRFMFLVDREALASPEKGKHRDAIRDLARRVSNNLNGRPIAIVWTKSDIEISSTIESDLHTCFNDTFPGHAEFRVRVRFGNETRQEVEEPTLALIDWAIGSQPQQLRERTVVPPQDVADLFLAYRGQNNVQ